MVGTLLLLTLTALGIEAWFRLAYEPSPEVVRFLFDTHVRVERWLFIAEHRKDVLTGSVLDERRPNAEWVQEPELDRPAFDRIPVAISIRTNPDGFRDPDFARARREGVLRVVVLGDSIVFGRGVPQAARFTERLAALAAREVEVWNLGVPGCTSDCMRELLRRYPDLHPDLVLIQVSANDAERVYWRLGADSWRSRSAIRALELLAHSRAALVLLHALTGEPWRRQAATMQGMVADTYGPALREILADVKAQGARAVLFGLPLATGERVDRHAEQACEAAADTCLGTLRVSFEDPARWVPEWAPGAGTSLPSRQLSTWLPETAAEIALPVALLEPQIPYWTWFHDIVHPTPDANRLMALQVDAFLRAAWPPWTATSPDTVREGGEGDGDGSRRVLQVPVP